jgi:hypothetical protein
MSNTRNGKIARLPRGIREQLNLKLDDGMEAEPLLAWVNELPETQKLVAEQFAGKPINPQNLSEWRQGGHQDWLREQERRELAGLLLEEGEEFAGTANGASLSNRLGVVFALELAAQLRRWQRETGEPKERWRQLRELFRELAELRREDHRAQRLKIANEKWAWETEALEEAKQLKLKKAGQGAVDALMKRVQGAIYTLGVSDEARQGEAEVVRAINRGQPLPEWVKKLLAEREAGEEGPETRRLRAASAKYRVEEAERKKTENGPRYILDYLDEPDREAEKRRGESPTPMKREAAGGVRPDQGQSSPIKPNQEEKSEGQGPKSESSPKPEIRSPESANEATEGNEAVQGTKEPRPVHPDQGQSSPIKPNQTESDA